MKRIFLVASAISMGAVCSFAMNAPSSTASTPHPYSSHRHGNLPRGMLAPLIFSPHWHPAQDHQFIGYTPTVPKQAALFFCRQIAKIIHTDTHLSFDDIRYYTIFNPENYHTSVLQRYIRRVIQHAYSNSMSTDPLNRAYPVERAMQCIKFDSHERGFILRGNPPLNTSHHYWAVTWYGVFRKLRSYRHQSSWIKPEKRPLIATDSPLYSFIIGDVLPQDPWLEAAYKCIVTRQSAAPDDDDDPLERKMMQKQALIKLQAQLKNIPI